MLFQVEKCWTKCETFSECALWKQTQNSNSRNGTLKFAFQKWISPLFATLPTKSWNSLMSKWLSPVFLTRPEASSWVWTSIRPTILLWLPGRWVLNLCIVYASGAFCTWGCIPGSETFAKITLAMGKCRDPCVGRIGWEGDPRTKTGPWLHHWLPRRCLQNRPRLRSINSGFLWCATTTGFPWGAINTGFPSRAAKDPASPRGHCTGSTSGPASPRGRNTTTSGPVSPVQGAQQDR